VEGSQAVIEWLLLVIAGPAAIGAALSWALEFAPYIPTWYKSLPYDAKRLFILAFCGGMSGGAVAVLYVLGYQATPDMIFQAVSAALMAYTSSQIAHLAVRRL
jgi:hypothetical protein